MVEEVLCRLKLSVFFRSKVRKSRKTSTAIHVQRILGAFQQLFIESKTSHLLESKRKSTLVKVL